jgi:hypothetical protein
MFRMKKVAILNMTPVPVFFEASAQDLTEPTSSQFLP